MGVNSSLFKPNYISFYATITDYERYSQCLEVLLEIFSTSCENSLLTLLLSNTQVVASGTRKNMDTSENQLVKHWVIRMEVEKYTIYATTQKVLRKVAHPSLSKYF